MFLPFGRNINGFNALHWFLYNIIRMMVLRYANSSFIWLLAPGVAALALTIKT